MIHLVMTFIKMQAKARNITKCFIKYFNYPIILKNEYEVTDQTLSFSYHLNVRCVTDVRPWQAICSPKGYVEFILQIMAGNRTPIN